MCGAESVVSYQDMRLLLLYKKDVMFLNTYFHKQDNKHIVITSRQRAFVVERTLQSVCSFPEYYGKVLG